MFFFSRFMLHKLYAVCMDNFQPPISEILHRGCKCGAFGGLNQHRAMSPTLSNRKFPPKIHQHSQVFSSVANNHTRASHVIYSVH